MKIFKPLRFGFNAAGNNYPGWCLFVRVDFLSWLVGVSVSWKSGYDAFIEEDIHNRGFEVFVGPVAIVWQWWW